VRFVAFAFSLMAWTLAFDAGGLNGVDVLVIANAVLGRPDCCRPS